MIKSNKIEVRTSTKRVNEAEENTPFNVTVRMPKDIQVANLRVLFNREGENPTVIEEMTLEDGTGGTRNKYTATVKLEKIGNYYYHFEFYDAYGNMQAIKLDRNSNEPTITIGEAPYFRILVVQKDFKVPDFAKGAIYYQLIVDRFNIGRNDKPQVKGRNYRNWGEMPNWKKNAEGKFHNNDFFRGDIKGIEEKLPYFKKLSVTVLYISPINFSLYRYDRYAATNHMLIDPDAGTFEDLASLSRAAHKMGIHLILDIALNHCSSDNPIFKDAISNPNSPYRDWFFIDQNGNYRYWYNEFVDMPIFNQQSQGYKDYVYGPEGVIAKFAPYVDGFRLDVAEELSQETLEGIRNRANKNGKKVIIAEWWNRASTGLFGKCFDATTNYLFTNAMYKWQMDGEAEYFAWQIRDVLENYPSEAISSMLNSLDTHDMVRALTCIGGKWMRHGLDRRWDIDKDPSPWHKTVNGIRIFDTWQFRSDEFTNDRLSPQEYRRAKKIYILMLIMQYTLPGNPCIFYGSEVGMHGYKDPFNRKTFPWNRIDKSILHAHIMLGAMREQNRKALSDANFELVRWDNENLYYTRNNLLIVINRGAKAIRVEIPEEFKTAEIIYTSNKHQKQVNEILAETGMILRRR